MFTPLTPPTLGKYGCFHWRESPKEKETALFSGPLPGPTELTRGRAQAPVIHCCLVEHLPLCALLRNIHLKGQNESSKVVLPG